MGAKLGISL